MMLWLRAFLFTQLIEVPIYSAALVARPLVLRLAIAFGASLITHPFVWMGVRWGSQWGYWNAVVVAEVAVVFIEALYLRGWRVRSALLWSLTANASSLAVGLLARYLSLPV